MTKKKVVGITLDGDVLRALDAYCKAKRQTRSVAAQAALIEVLERANAWPPKEKPRPKPELGK